MTPIEQSPEKLPIAFPPTPIEWYTSQHLRRVLEPIVGRVSNQEIIHAAEELEKMGLLDVHFMRPFDGPPSGFRARLAIVGRRMLVKTLKADS